MRSVMLLFVLCIVAPTASLALVFGGYIRTADDIRFVLIDETAGTSKFVRLGDSFLGHKLLSFDGGADILSVQRIDSGAVTHLKLKGSSVKDAHWNQIGSVLTILVRADGSIAQNGSPVHTGLLGENFRQAAVDGWLFLRVKFPPGNSKESIVQTLHMLRQAFRASGVLGRIIYEFPD